MTAEIPEVPGLTDLSPLGCGGLADVYLARQGHLQRWVAAKVFRVTLADEQAAERFRAECSAIGRLDQYPHVLTVYDAGVLPDGRPYLISERCDGSLSDLVEMRGPLPADRVSALGSTIARALRFAHSAGVLHGDVTPQNLLLRTSGAPVLADFGLAVLRDHAPTAAGFTLLHAAPEALRAGTVIDERADVYGLGSTLFTVLTGAPPFPPEPGEDADTYRRRVRDLPPPRPDGAPEQLAGLLVSMLAPEPSHRPSTDEIVTALQTAPGRTTSPSDDGVLMATRPDTDLGYDSIAVPASAVRVERRRWGVVPGARRRAAAPAPRTAAPAAADERPITRTVWATKQSGEPQRGTGPTRPGTTATTGRNADGGNADGATVADRATAAPVEPGPAVPDTTTRVPDPTAQVPDPTAQRPADPPAPRSGAVASADPHAPAGSAAPSVAAALASYAARTGTAPFVPPSAPAAPDSTTATVARATRVPSGPTARRPRSEPVDQDTRAARPVDQDVTAVGSGPGCTDVLIDRAPTPRASSVPSPEQTPAAVRPVFVSLTVSPPTAVAAPADPAEGDDPAATRVMEPVGSVDARETGTTDSDDARPGAAAADPIEREDPAVGPEASAEDTRVLTAWVSGLQDPVADAPSAEPVRIPGRPRRRRQRRALIAAGGATAVLVTGAGVGAVWRSLDQSSPTGPEAPTAPATPNVVAAPGAPARAVEADLPRGRSADVVTGEALAEGAFPGITRPGSPDGAAAGGTPAARSVAPRPSVPRSPAARPAADPAPAAPARQPRPPAAPAPADGSRPGDTTGAEGRVATIADDESARGDRDAVDRSGTSDQPVTRAR